MHYLIDGHNLIAQMPDISLDDPNDEALLVLRLRSWVAGSRKRQVTVIFDGGLPGGRSRFHSTGKVNVIFAPERSTADALLIRRIRKVNNPPEYTLISSDLQVIGAARARRMKHFGTEEFAKRLSESGRKDQRASVPVAQDEAEEPAVSQDEVAEWLALFDAAPKIRREAPKPSPRQEPKDAQSNGKPAKESPVVKNDVDPATLKRGTGKLSSDEVDEWLKLFGQSD